MRFALGLILSLATGAAAAPVPKEFKKADDAAAVLGTWKTTALTVAGRADANIHTHTFVFEADGKCHSLFGKGNRSDWTYTLDPKATPKRMTWTSAPVGRGPQFGALEFDCVYEVSGNTFKLGFLPNAQAVPDKVELGPGLTLYEMKREK